MPVAPNDPRLEKCGFAKLLGEGYEFFVKKYEVTMGRKSKSTALDIVLGDNMNISRHHATIRYNFDTSKFELVVLGKNGVHCNGVLHTPSSGPVELKSQDLISLGDKSFYFLLPKAVNKTDVGAKRSRSSGPPVAKTNSGAKARKLEHRTDSTLHSSLPKGAQQAAIRQPMGQPSYRALPSTSGDVANHHASHLRALPGNGYEGNVGRGHLGGEVEEEYEQEEEEQDEEEEGEEEVEEEEEEADDPGRAHPRTGTSHQFSAYGPASHVRLSDRPLMQGYPPSNGGHLR